MGKRRPRRGAAKPKAKTEVVSVLASEFKLAPDRITTMLRSVGINPDQLGEGEDLGLCQEVIACKIGDRSRYVNTEEGYEEALDEQLRSFDEIYVDTAPILQEDWFLYFVNDAMEIIKRRKKKLIVLEKTLEELHGLKNNPEKDRPVRVRATIRPDLLRTLARRGVVRIGDTGSIGIADDHLVRLFAHVGSAMDLLLITQDRRRDGTEAEGGAAQAVVPTLLQTHGRGGSGRRPSDGGLQTGGEGEAQAPLHLPGVR